MCNTCQNMKIKHGQYKQLCLLVNEAADKQVMDSNLGTDTAFSAMQTVEKEAASLGLGVVWSGIFPVFRVGEDWIPFED